MHINSNISVTIRREFSLNDRPYQLIRKDCNTVANYQLTRERKKYCTRPNKKFHRDEESISRVSMSFKTTLTLNDNHLSRYSFC